MAVNKGNKRNVIVGAATLYIGPAGTAKPMPMEGEDYRVTMDTPLGVPATDGTDPANWREIGYTTDGVEFATDPTYEEITVDQQMDTVRMFKSGMTASVSTTMAEATLENLIVAWGQADDTIDTLTTAEKELVIEAGELGDAPVERGLIIIGNAPEVEAAGRFGQRIYHVYRALSVEGATTNMSKTDASTIPVTFRAFPDDATGRYGTIRDRAGTDGFGTVTP